MKKLFFIALLCVAAQLAWAEIVVTTDAEIRSAVQEDNANIQLGADIDLSNSTLSIDKGLTVTIDLNGHKLDRKLTKRGEGGGQVITVREGATLNLSNGTLAGGWGGNAGGLSNESGTVNMTDVTVTGCTGVNRGGGICNFGTLTMIGGVITNNVSKDDKVNPSDHTGGGGLFNEEGATATLTNVNISGNTAAIYGGGGICNYGTLTLDGCAIQGNKANSNGGAIWEEGTLNMQGANLISANKGGTASDGIDDDIYLWKDRLIHVTGSLSGSVIRVHMNQLGVFTDGYSTYNNGVNPATIFTSEVPTAVAVVLDGDEANFSSALPEGTVYYIARSWDEENKKVTTEVKTLPSGMYSTLTGGDDITITPGYYVVNSNIERDDIILSSDGDYYLIVCDGCQVKADIVNVAPGKTLYVYAQAANTGRLYIPYGNDDEMEREACIGGRRNESCGTVIIHGGDVYAEGRYGAATIGGGMGGNGGTVTIFGGTVYVKGGGSTDACGAGIGSGHMGDGGTVTIYGGKVTAETPWGGAGIGAGSNHDSGGGTGPFLNLARKIKQALHDDVDPHNGGTVNIYGGEVYAYAGAGAAGIGGGENTGGADVTINGGIVKAYGGENGAGIGTGYEHGNIRYNGKLTVNGGEVYAYGGDDAAGIGGGYDASGSEVIINGGYVYAKGDGNGAGIGSGCESIFKGGLQGGTLTVNGGEVYAYGGVDAAGIGGGEDADGGKVTITGGYVLAQGNDWGAGIGGGQGGDGAKVTITGGTVIAKAGRNETECRAIGPGEGCDVYGSLTLGDDMMVTSERKFTAAERKNACWYRTQVRVEPCDHEGATYTVDGITAADHHISHCNYCLHSDTALHTFDGHGTCTVCGVQGEVKAVNMWLPKAPYDGHTYGPTDPHSVVPNTHYLLPMASVQVPGYKFIGWEPTTEPTGDSYTSPYTTATATLYPAGDHYTVTDDIQFVARYKVTDITLYDNAPNDEALAEFNDHTVNSATLSGRTLTKDNSWQTLALPFALNAEALAASPLAGCELKQLDLDGEYDGNKTGYDLSTNTLYLYFQDATEIEAGKPYVIRWASGANIENPRFSNVTITNQSASVYAPHCIFVSLYSPKSFTAEDRNVVYLGANNTFLQPEGAETIGAFRGFFRLMKFEWAALTSTPLTIITNLEGAVIPTEVESIQPSAVSIQKYIQNGILFINRDGKTYNANGQITK